jgi:hypothetical protein
MRKIASSTIQYARWNMKVVQTVLSDSEHKLLEEYAERNSKTIKEVLKEAIRKTVVEDKVSPTDPLFVEPPVSRRTGKKDDASVKHNLYLYGEKRRR